MREYALAGIRKKRKESWIRAGIVAVTALVCYLCGTHYLVYPLIVYLLLQVPSKSMIHVSRDELLASLAQGALRMAQDRDSSDPRRELRALYRYTLRYSAIWVMLIGLFLALIGFAGMFTPVYETADSFLSRLCMIYGACILAVGLIRLLLSLISVPDADLDHALQEAEPNRSAGNDPPEEPSGKNAAVPFLYYETLTADDLKYQDATNQALVRCFRQKSRRWPLLAAYLLVIALLAVIMILILVSDGWNAGAVAELICLLIQIPFLRLIFRSPRNSFRTLLLARQIRRNGVELRNGTVQGSNPLPLQGFAAYGMPNRAAGNQISAVVIFGRLFHCERLLPTGACMTATIRGQGLPFCVIGQEDAPQ